MTQLVDQFNITLISQVFNDISRVLPKFPKYFNGTVISKFFVAYKFKFKYK